MNIYKKISFLLIAFIYFESCNDNPVSTNNVSLNSDFKIKYGQSVYIPDENLFIAFQDVVEESRCPEGLRCFVQGTAKIKLLIRQGNDTVTDTVETYLPQSIVSVGQINNSYLFDVKDVKPYPKQNIKIDVHNYALTLNISHFTYGFSDSEIENKTGIYGQVFISPIAPVEIAGHINYKPFRTSLTFVDNKNDSTFVQTDSIGKFISFLNVGEYHLAPVKGLPSLNDMRIFTVAEKKMIYIKVYLESGIR